MSDGETALDHVLVVHDDPEDGLDVEHAPDCPYDEEETPIGPVRFYRCAVESRIDSGGFGYRHEATVPEPFKESEPLAPGRYPLGAWWSVHPGGPWGPTEYDAGLVRGDREGVSS